jgi:hypothetical protein
LTSADVGDLGGRPDQEHADPARILFSLRPASTAFGFAGVTWAVVPWR